MPPKHLLSVGTIARHAHIVLTQATEATSYASAMILTHYTFDKSSAIVKKHASLLDHIQDTRRWGITQDWPCKNNFLKIVITLL